MNKFLTANNFLIYPKKKKEYRKNKQEIVHGNQTF